MSLEEKVENAVTVALETLGYEIVRIKYILSEANTLQVMIDKASGDKISIDDCAKVSRMISTILDVEDFISDEYHLEVTSPGINRPIIKQKDFVRFKGHDIQLRLKEAQEGMRNFKGKIIKVENNNVILELKENKDLQISIEEIDSASLV